MRKFGVLIVFCFSCIVSFAQFEYDKLQIKFGYNIHNTRASRFNHLINSFNKDRYPLEIKDNLPSINFLHGLSFGAVYEFRDDIYIHTVLKNKHQFLETQYETSPNYRQFLFRENSLEAGVSIPFEETKWFSHNFGGGILASWLSVFTNWTEESGNPGSGSMLNIDHNLSIGISLHYEARIKLLPFAQLFIRPVLQYNLNSDVRSLNAFMNPTLIDSQITYSVKEEDKFNKGGLNGIGIEAGLLILLPQF